jgi:hypothetical protein
MKGIIVNIKRVDWIDKENPEAEVLFLVKGKEFWAFCHPCDFKEEETAEVYFSFLEDEILESAFWNENKEQKKDIVASRNNRCYYYCFGQLKNINPVIIDCGHITFSYGDWINDETLIGNYVYFVIARLDISRV